MACEITDLETFAACMEDKVSVQEISVNTFWLMFGAVLVFFMQTGFAMLEVGAVQAKNAKNILIKNVFDASLGGIMWYTTGYGIALGSDSYETSGNNGFIGTDGFLLTTGAFRGSGDDVGINWAGWLFQWAFAATTATIVSGAVVERVTFGAYVVYAMCLLGFIYPVVVHWGWSAGGWASAWRETELLMDCGVLDFAGSGVVHMTGGTAALVGAVLLGPRSGRFIDGIPVELPQLSFVYQTLGTLCLWMGWYGFNGVSTLAIVGLGEVAARAMVNTTIAGGVACVTSVTVAYFRIGYVDITAANNGVLGGLVAITAGCSVVMPEGAVVIGFVAGFVYNASSVLLLKLQIDDVVDASPVHMFCGMWGVLAAGLLAEKDNYGESYYSERQGDCCGAFYGCGGNQFTANLIFVIVVLGWAGFCSFLMFTFAKYTVGLRVSKAIEDAGMDDSKHGGMTMPSGGDSLSNSRVVKAFPPGAAGTDVEGASIQEHKMGR
ncbi:Ammonium transporter [Ectocarpus siliculosus]|uniref:Ammonium transporter n=1 Tax=Ectocarpus siliculosus TaxID=2880 RepID=D7G3S7_ECTSI|nr:Ammonium transporter [Ectocarpus siliculosus]|eukprot:CBJ33604.1 Ammonium transporter [Ectocarpus siliculosus]